MSTTIEAHSASTVTLFLQGYRNGIILLIMDKKNTFMYFFKEEVKQLVEGIEEPKGAEIDIKKVYKDNPKA